MADEFDDFARALQDQIYEETREAYGQIAFERWLKPLYAGVLPNPEGYGRVKGTCGDTMEIFLRFERDRVKEAAFQTDGCGSSTVCGSFAAELVHGRSSDEIAEITGEMILDVLGGLPKEDRHCAFLAAETLQEALDDYMRKQLRRDNLEPRTRPEK
jgi:nitrogen fixation NifU-like protein